MKKSAIILSILSVSLFSGAAFAEDQKMEGMDRKGGKMHEPPKMVATSDGGVIILAGRKLLKYDGLLNLVKEVEMQGGPTPKKMGGVMAEEISQPEAEFKPIDDAQIAAMLEQEAPAAAPFEAPAAEAEAPIDPEPTPGQ